MHIIAENYKIDNENLDILIAKHVMGWKIHPEKPHMLVPYYSTEAHAYNQLLELLYKIPYMKIRIDISHYHGIYVVLSAPDKTQQDINLQDAGVYCVDLNELGRAICIAILVSFGYESTIY